MRLLATIAASCLLASCGGRTFVSSTTDFPDGKPSVYVKVIGADLHSYNDATIKDVYIRVKSAAPEDASLTGYAHHRVFGASIAWDVVWQSESMVTVYLYDYPEGLSIYDKEVKEGKVAKNHLAELKLVRGADSVSFRCTNCQETI